MHAHPLMLKYYVVCGEIQFATMAWSHLDACMRMMTSVFVRGKQQGETCFIDERGFRTNELGQFGPASHVIPTKEVHYWLHYNGGTCGEEFEDGCEGI